MIDLILVYCLFAYLFTFGVILSAWDDYKDKYIDGMILWLLLSPLMMPIYLGIDHQSKAA